MKAYRQPAIDSQHQEMKRPLSAKLGETLQMLRSIYDRCEYVTIHEFVLSNRRNAALIYIENLSGKEAIDKFVLVPLIAESSWLEAGESMKAIQEKIPVSKIYTVDQIADVIERVSIGYPVLLVDLEDQGLALGLSQSTNRSIEEPIAESIVRGSRDGFTENLMTNTSLLLRRIRSPKLKMNCIKIGRYTQTDVVITYIDGIADSDLVSEITARLKQIDVDGILESGYLEEFLEGNSYSPFPQFIATERPDVTCSNLLEGRIAILVDGTPFTIIAPTTFFSLLQSPEDYNNRFIIGTMIRWLRYLFIGISLLGPSAYIAILTYHHEMIPTILLLSIVESREDIPFPALIEALLMEVTFEALREAGLRLPKQVGPAVSIVGALVIGQAATAAGLVSFPMVMVVAITGIASFLTPHYTLGITIRMLRFPIMIMAGMMGLLGIILSLILIVVHLSTLRSFGIPYLTPLAPFKPNELKDVLIRAPWWRMTTRPSLAGAINKYRQAPGQRRNKKEGEGAE
ncbi:spore germination protein [Paenibacillus sp. CF384]|uniref:spore germination protein n=1 Tax=Paenibacillus sp. CF384 TaxID=1884382 RepID=UPI000896038D|nr:spore germination protein [Paenibacillus sp. CF384]SDW19503.1 spore germination protein KA [Paenibacillus sp. CF384]